jgi:hypothetical protein
LPFLERNNDRSFIAFVVSKILNFVCHKSYRSENFNGGIILICYLIVPPLKFYSAFAAAFVDSG